MLVVKLFAKAQDLAGASEVRVPWEDGQTVAHLKQMLAEAYPAMAPIMPRLFVAINNDFATETATMKSSDEVACFPPVSGG